MINNIENDSILYYADYLSLRDISIPVTDNCKYYFIHGLPINSARLVDLEPFYDIENKYYIESFTEYYRLKDKFGEDGINSFIEQICNLKPLGVVGAKQMLQCIHQYNSRSDRKTAFKKYEKWLSNQKYEITTINDEGELESVLCTRYIAHAAKKKNNRPDLGI